MNKLVMAPTVLPAAKPVDYLEAAAAARYQSVGLRLHRSLVMPFHPVVGDEPQIRAIKQSLAASGIEVLEVTSFYLMEAMDLPEYQAAMELGAELGGKYVLVIGADPDWSRQVDSFGRLCEMAGKLGMTCAVENAPNRLLSTVGSIARMIDEAGAGNAGICLDPINHFLAGGTAADLAAMDPKLFPYTQIADGLSRPQDVEIVDGKQKHMERRPLGRGNMDVDGLLDALPQGLPISLELPIDYSAQLTADGALMAPAEWARYALNDTRNYLEGYYSRRDRTPAAGA